MQLQASDHFVVDDTAQLFVSPSIQANRTLTMEGFLRARIASPGETAPSATPHLQKDVKISITATLPWLDRVLPLFDVERTFDIQYPCAFSNTDALASVAPGSSSNVMWEVRNPSKTPN